ncbi:hypothetical protein EDC01DRAFT_784304 [Geopyxis carbonaria]|nr:hypothetical protein EDC01DRAFT_784304 [Geopyxis carbonaria]
MAPYMPDNSYQRFRVLKFGKLTAFMNEATLECLSYTLKGFALENMDDSCWFTTDGGQIKPMINSAPTQGFQQIVTTTGDLPTTENNFRIQIRQTIQQTPWVLALDSSHNLRAVEYDTYDRNQIWNQLEWEKGRFITHVATGKLLGIASDWNSVELADGYSSHTMWRLDSSVSTIGNGFFKLDNTGLALDILADPSATKPLLATSTSPYGCRFVSESSNYTLTHRHMVLKTFIRSHGPVFVHAKGVTPPTDEVEFPEEIHALNPGFSTFSATPKVYIIVRQSSEPIYLNYTDISYCLWYAPAYAADTTRGWRFITARYNNTTKALESVYFPGGGQGWIYNIDLNFSVMTNPDQNQLKVVKRQKPSLATKLHVYVGPDLVIRPDFPPPSTNADIVDAEKWGTSLESGEDTIGRVVEAEMLVDDQSGSKPTRPLWVESSVPWTTGGEGQFMPVGILNGL